VIRGCPPGPTFEAAALVYVACGHTVFVMERGEGDSVAERRRQRMDGAVVSFFEREGTVWAELRKDTGEARAAPVTLEPSPEARLEPRRTAPPRPRADGRLPPPPPAMAPAPLDPDRWSQRAVTPRAPGTSLRAGIAPFLGDGEYGVVVTGGVSYRAEIPLTIHAALDPYAFGSNLDGKLSTYAVRVDASVDTDFVEIGFGTGAQRYRQTSWDLGERLAEDTHAPNLGFRARFGSLDGIHLDTRIRWAFVDGVTRFSDVFMEFLVPTWKHGWIQVTGGGGERLGYFDFNAGVRTSALGKTELENLFLTFAIGWAQLRDATESWRTGTAQGFQASFSLEYRIPSSRSAPARAH
jgi:hypothetical protein